MEEQSPKEEKRPRIMDSGKLIRLAGTIFVAGVGGSVACIYSVPENMRTMMLGVAMAAFMGGGMKLIQMLQTHLTDKKVEKDLETTQNVASALNGGFDDRVTKIVRGVLKNELPAALAQALQKHEDKGPPPPRVKT